MSTRIHTLRQTLTQARQQLAKSSGWIQGTLAADRTGQPVDLADPTACQFCALGAIARVTGNTARGPRFAAARSALTQVLPGGYVTVVGYNDAHNRTKPQILALFDRALKALP